MKGKFKGGLLTRPVQAGKMSLADSFIAMARDQKAKTESLEWAASNLTDGLAVLSATP